MSIHQALTAISRPFSGHWQVLLTTFTWHAPFAHHASDKNHKLHQSWRCCLPMLCSSIRGMIDQFVCFFLLTRLWTRTLPNDCILFSCHIESSPVCSMFAAWRTILPAAVHFTASLVSCAFVCVVCVWVSVAVVVLQWLACLLRWPLSGL